MSEMDGLQGIISRNVKMLMVMRGIGTNRQLARLLDQDEQHLSNRLRGRRKWQVHDLERLAEVFGIAPGLLLGMDVAALAEAVGPTPALVSSSSTSTMAGASPTRTPVNHRYHSCLVAPASGFVQVGRVRRPRPYPRSARRPSPGSARSHGVK